MSLPRQAPALKGKARRGRGRAVGEAECASGPEEWGPQNWTPQVCACPRKCVCRVLCAGVCV